MGKEKGAGRHSGFAKLQEKRNDDLCREMVELEVAVLSRYKSEAETDTRHFLSYVGCGFKYTCTHM